MTRKSAWILVSLACAINGCTYNVAMPDRFIFKNAEADLDFCISQYQGDCQIQKTRNGTIPNPWQISFKRGDFAVLNLPAHDRTVFRADENCLYWVEFMTAQQGGSVTAYEMTEGGRKWTKELKGIGGVSHKIYSNQINLALTDDGVMVTGTELYGDYVEVLDRQSGRRLGHKIFRYDFNVTWPKGSYW